MTTFPFFPFLSARRNKIQICSPAGDQLGGRGVGAGFIFFQSIKLCRTHISQNSPLEMANFSHFPFISARMNKIQIFSPAGDQLGGRGVGAGHRPRRGRRQRVLLVRRESVPHNHFPVLSRRITVGYGIGNRLQSYFICNVLEIETKSFLL